MRRKVDYLAVEQTIRPGLRAEVESQSLGRDRRSPPAKQAHCKHCGPSPEQAPEGVVEVIPLREDLGEWHKGQVVIAEVQRRLQMKVEVVQSKERKYGKPLLHCSQIRLQTDMTVSTFHPSMGPWDSPRTRGMPSGHQGSTSMLPGKRPAGLSEGPL